MRATVTASTSALITRLSSAHAGPRWEMSRSLLNLRTEERRLPGGPENRVCQDERSSCRTKGAANDEENRESRANAREEWDRPGAGASGGADARRDVEHAPALGRASCRERV